MNFEHGLHDLGNTCFAYLQPDGGWGWSNAGLVVGDGASLLIDTLFDLKLTGAMLDSMTAVTSLSPITTVVNTHANGDHCYGNQLVADREIIASAAAALEMSEVPPSMMAALNGAEGALGATFRSFFGAFDFDGIELTLPNRTFSDHLDVDVAGTRVELIEVGPAHTRGDVIAHVPSASTVFTGDVLFVGGTPIVWAGPLQNWINACDRILGLGADIIVPGHGPVTDDNGVIAVRDYLNYVEHEARDRFDAGLNAWEAAQDIDLGPYRSLGERGRIAVNVEAAYRGFDPGHASANVIELFTHMADLEARA